MALLEHAGTELGGKLFVVETQEEIERWRSWMKKAGLRWIEGGGKVGDDEDLVLCHCRFNVGEWQEVEKTVTANRAWPTRRNRAATNAVPSFTHMKSSSA